MKTSIGQLAAKDAVAGQDLSWLSCSDGEIRRIYHFGSLVMVLDRGAIVYEHQNGPAKEQAGLNLLREYHRKGTKQ